MKDHLPTLGSKLEHICGSEHQPGILPPWQDQIPHMHPLVDFFSPCFTCKEWHTNHGHLQEDPKPTLLFRNHPVCPALIHLLNLHVPAQNPGTVFSIFGNTGHTFPMNLAQLRCSDPPLPATKACLTTSSQRTALFEGGSLPRCAQMASHQQGWSCLAACVKAKVPPDPSLKQAEG